jgi:hypothetical protein
MPDITLADIVRPSTVEEMKAFALRFNLAEWNLLCKSKVFMELIFTDINKSKILAEKILAGKGDKI